MKYARRRILSFVAIGALGSLIAGCGAPMSVLNPKGPVAHSELNLIIWSFSLMMIVVLAVFAIYAYVLIRYRARPSNKDYQPPEIHGNRKLELIWTGVPILMLAALAVPAIKTTYALVKPPTVANPLIVDVTALNWKWVFEYPDAKVATVNYVEVPAGRPVEFMLTADAPMNSFWVPSLGGQEYAMPGMVLGLWLEATNPGSYEGRSANFSGLDFTNMTFTVKAVPEHDYNAWVSTVRKQAPAMTNATYTQLQKPGLVPVMTFSSYPGTAARIFAAPPMM